MSQRGRGRAAGQWENLSRPIVCRVTEIVNQPFPSKVHALTGRVNTPNRALRVISEVGRLPQYKDAGNSQRSSSAFTLSAPIKQILGYCRVRCQPNYSWIFLRVSVVKTSA